MVEILSFKPRSGTDVLESLKEFAEENEIDYGFFENASGKLANFEVSAFSGSGSIENKYFKEPHDVLNVSGKIQRKGSEYEIALKVRVGRSGLSAFSGVLIQGKASEGLEINIRKVKMGNIIEA